MDAIRFDIRLKLVLIGIVAAILLFLPMAVKGANNIASNISQNGSAFELTSALWTERSGMNLSLATSTGMTIALGTMEIRTNSTGAKVLVRIVRDGIEIQRANITESPYIFNLPIMAVQTETAGTHYYAMQIYSPAGKKVFVNNWTFGVQYLQTGEYLASAEGYVTNTSAQITTTQVTGLPGTLNLMNGSAETNDTYRQNNDSSIRAAMALQNQSGEMNNTYRQTNDTATRNAMTLMNQSQDSNNTAFKNTFGLMNTSSETNNTARIAGDDLINSTKVNKSELNSTVDKNLSNYTNTPGFITSTYNSTYNSTYDAKEPAISQGVSPQFWMFNKTWQNITTTWITEGVNLWFTNARAISAVQSILDAMNSSSQGGDDSINSTKLNKSELNSTVDKNLSNYTNTPGFITSTYNATYDLKLTNVSAGNNITITWTGCPSACVAQINSSGGGGITSESDPLWSSSANQTKFNNAENITNKSTDTALGTSNTLYPTQNAVKSYVDTKPPAVHNSSSHTSFESAEQTVTANSATNVAHGLGAIPKMAILILRCKTAELGYAVDDEIIYSSQYDPSGGKDASIVFNGTSATILVGNAPVVIHKTTFSTIQITPGNWKWVVRAWK